MYYINMSSGTIYFNLYVDNTWGIWKPLNKGFVKSLTDREDLNNLYYNGWYATSYVHSYLHSPDEATNARREFWITSGKNEQTSSRYQHYYNYTSGKEYVRLYHDNVWDDWKEANSSMLDSLLAVSHKVDDIYFQKISLLGNANKVKFPIRKGDSIVIRTADSSKFSVTQINGLSAEGTVINHYNLAATNSNIRTVTSWSFDCEYISLEGGTAQEIVIVNNSKTLAGTIRGITILQNNDDLDSLLCAGVYIGSYSYSYTHAPENSIGRKMIVVLENSLNNSQYYMFYLNFQTSAKYERYYAGNAWSAWKPMSNGFVKSLADEEDLNDLYFNGWYATSYVHSYLHSPDEATNARREFWITSGTNAANAFRYQHYYNYTSGKEYVRLYHDNVWDDWKEANSSSYDDGLADGAAYNVNFPLNSSYRSGISPYDYHPKVVTLLHCSDIHTRSEEFTEMMNWASKNQNLFDDILFTGDIVEYYDEETGVDYMEFWKKVKNSEKILVTIGNHDAKDQAVSSVANWERKSMARSRELYMYGIDTWGVTSPNGKTYWYKDYSNSDLRLIGLDTTVVSGSDEDLAQQTWLTGVLSDAKTNQKSIVIAQHYQPKGGTKVLCDYTADNINVPNNANMAMPMAYYGIVQDFIDSEGKFVCWLAGHTHTDFVCYDSNYPDQIFFVVTSLWSDLRGSDQARIKGTSSFIAGNLIGFDTRQNLIKLVRVGANYDSNLRPRNILVYNYRTKQIVRQSSGIN